MFEPLHSTPEDLGAEIGALVAYWLDIYAQQCGTKTIRAATANAVVVQVSTALADVLDAYLMAAENVPGAAALVESFEAATSSLVTFATDDAAARAARLATSAAAAAAYADVIYSFEATTPTPPVALEGVDDAENVPPPKVNRGNPNYRARKDERPAGRGVTYTGRPY
jgi:hypothetical protein